MFDVHRILHDATGVGISASLADGDFRCLYKIYKCFIIKKRTLESSHWRFALAAGLIPTRAPPVKGLAAAVWQQKKMQKKGKRGK